MELFIQAIPIVNAVASLPPIISWSWWAQNGVGLLVVILCFGFIIFIHELGHFLMAKRVGVRVLEFALGFGPRIFMRKKGETEYSLRLFPVGGYVRMEGEDSPAQDSKDPGNFQNKTVWGRIKIVASGPLMNYSCALLMFWFVGFVYGVGEFYPKPRVKGILKDMPADKIDLRAGDYIIEIDGKPIADAIEMIMTINKNPDRELTLKVLREQEGIGRDGKKKHILLTKKVRTKAVEDVSLKSAGFLGYTPQKGFFTIKIPLIESEIKGMIGFEADYQSPETRFTRMPASMVIKNGFLQMYHFSSAPFIALQMLVAKRISTKELKEGSSGPVGIAQMLFEMYKKGFKSLLYFGAVLNVLIGFFNLIPFPALDGSRIFFLGIAGIRKKPIDQEKEGLIHLIGFIILLSLVLYFTYFDVLRLFHKKSIFGN